MDRLIRIFQEENAGKNKKENENPVDSELKRFYFLT